jgi:hypothetical protein
MPSRCHLSWTYQIRRVCFTPRATDILAIDMHQFSRWYPIPARWAWMGQIKTLGIGPRMTSDTLPTVPALVQVDVTVCP